MAFDLLMATVKLLVERLARGDYDAVVAESSASRLTADELGNAVREYGRTLVPPPEAAYWALDAIAVRDATLPTWSVRAPLWTQEEGQSDLTLELTVTLSEDRLNYEVDDLHVL